MNFHRLKVCLILFLLWNHLTRMEMWLTNDLLKGVFGLLLLLCCFRLGIWNFVNLLRIFLILSFCCLLLFILLFLYRVVVFVLLLAFFVLCFLSLLFLLVKSNLFRHSISLLLVLVVILVIPIFVVILILLNLNFILFLDIIMCLIRFLLLFILLIVKITFILVLKHWYFEFDYFTVYSTLNY